MVKLDLSYDASYKSYSISFEVFPTPENTIFLGFIPALSAFISSPPDTTSAPKLFFLISLNIPKFEFAFRHPAIHLCMFV